MNIDKLKTAAEDAIFDLMRFKGDAAEKARVMAEIAEQAASNAISLQRRVQALDVRVRWAH